MFLTEAPIVSISPERVVTRKGNSFILKCKASGSPPPSVQWKKVGVKHLPLSLLVSDTELVVTTAGPEEAGTYACAGRNVHGTHVSYANVSVVGMLTLFFR